MRVSTESSTSLHRGLTLGIYSRRKQDVDKNKMMKMKKRRKGAREHARKWSDCLIRFGMTYLDTVVQGNGLVERHFRFWS
jgi:hypothetical protein